jgi:hypothetical protein
METIFPAIIVADRGAKTTFSGVYRSVSGTFVIALTVISETILFEPSLRICAWRRGGV